MYVHLQYKTIKITHMEFINAMRKRYSTKKYDATKKINAKLIEELKEILVLSPSSINSQPWQFQFVSNPEIKKELAAASLFNEEKINQCDTLVVFNSIYDVEVFEKQIKENLPQSAIDYYNTHLAQLTHDELRVWFDKQVYLSLGILLAACAQMEIDATPMEGIEAEKYHQILKMDGYTSLFAVAIGYRDADDKNQPSHKPKSRLAQEAVVKTI